MDYNPQRDVAQMMRIYGQEVKPHPEMPDEPTRILRARLMVEEDLETVLKGLGVQIVIEHGDEMHVVQMSDLKFRINGPGSLVELADGIADKLVTTYGTANAAGINAAACFAEVHDSNMTKTNTDGTVTRDSFGKVVKPAHYRPANMAKVLGVGAGS
jgi:predicted HAD superfamily Cof-like phosphohydrolase